MKTNKRNLIILLAVLIGALSGWMYHIAPTNGSPLSVSPAPVESSTREPDATMSRTLDAESQIEHDNSTSEPVDADIQEPDTALPRATNVENPIEQIKSGDFSSLTGADESLLSNLNFAFDSGEFYNRFHNNRKDEDMEWIEYDINKDGTNELIYQQKYSHYESGLMKRIVAIFAFHGQETELVILDIVDMPRYYFLSQNGNIVYYNFFHGPIQEDSYSYYVFDEEWNATCFYDLSIVCVDFDEFDENQMKWFLDYYPGMTESGVYYRKHTRQDGELCETELDEQQFLEAFKEMTGTPFNNMKPY